MPAGNVTQLIADPKDSNHFYAAVAKKGVFQVGSSGTGEIDWTEMNTGLTHFGTSEDIQTTAPGVFNGSTVLYALVVGHTAGEQGAFRLDTNGGNTTWTALAQPPADNFASSDDTAIDTPDQSGSFITADPVDPQVAYITGYGSNPYHVYRYDASNGGSWQTIQGDGPGGNPALIPMVGV